MGVSCADGVLLMDSIDRRTFLAGALAGLPALSESLGTTGQQGPGKPAHVGPGGDRLGQPRTVLGGMHIDFKVLTRDTNGALFVIEHRDGKPGGPPKHVHHEQDEWFYILEGHYRMEVGDEQFALGPGDSVLAPRKVPHVWAHVDGNPGKLLIAFQPAGLMESFFEKLSAFREMPSQPEMAALFAGHGMQLLGPPMKVGI